MKKIVVDYVGKWVLIVWCIAFYIFIGPVVADEPSTVYTQQQYTPNVEEQLSLFSGSATYRYPFEVAPGTNGMQPDLALSYSSSTKSGVIGYGWSLSGLDVVSRSAQNGVPQYDDGDRFVWNGEELVLGSDGYYHTKKESFARIENFGGFGVGSYWLITKKNGTQFRYGSTSDSRIEAVRRSGEVRCWALDQIKDTNGNYLTISYSEDSVNGDFYADSVRYTLNDAGGLTTYRTVQFFWESRDDIRVSYHEGAKVETDQRLTRIEVRIDSNLLREYRLTYTKGSAGKSLLSSITECGTDGDTCLPPTTFSYRDLLPGFGDPLDWGSAYGAHIRNSESGHTVADMIDINGDALPDSVYRRNQGNFHVRLNNGTEFTESLDWGNGHDHYIRYASGGSTYSDLMDINGDGRPDHVYRFNDGNFKVRLNTGRNFAASENWETQESSYLRHRVGESTHSDILDMNGDGLPDHVYRYDSGNFKVRLNNGSDFGTTKNWGAGLGSHLRESISGDSLSDLRDMNGDGLPDQVYRNNSGNFVVRLNTGSKFGESRDWGTGFSSYIRDGNGNATYSDLIDLNSDGLPDHVFRYEGGNFSVRLNTGSGFNEPMDWGSGFGSHLRNGANGNTYNDLMDMNGDGVPDQVYRYNSGNLSVRLNQAAFTDLLVEIGNSKGGKIIYTYAAAAEFDHQDEFGVERLPNSMTVVVAVSTDDGLGQEATKTIEYKGGFYNRPSNEFRGFREISVTDATDAVTVTGYYQADTVWGREKSVDRYEADGTLFHAVENQYAVEIVDATAAIAFARLDRKDVHRYDGYAEAFSNAIDYAYDSYGNITSEEHSGDVFINGDEMRTTTQYAYNTNDWLVDRRKYSLTEAYDSATSSWIKKQEDWTYYDLQAHGTVTLGNVTKAEQWLDTTGGVVRTTMGYDVYGNQVWMKDGNAHAGGNVNSNGHTTDITFDSTYSTVPVSVVNALNQTESTAYDTFLRAISATDVNGQTTATSYDELSRVETIIKPGDNSNYPTTEMEYFFDGKAPDYTLTRQRVEAGTSNVVEAIIFVDGFGRAIQRKEEAATSGEWVTTDTYYDPLGREQARSLPYITSTIETVRDASQQRTLKAYDALNRLITTTKPDGTQSTVDYDRDRKSIQDALGRQRNFVYDGFGRVQQIDEVLNGETLSTTYNHDRVTGKLLSIVDARNGTYSFTYDSLARKVSQSDGDLGQWDYEYDANGNLTSQTDGRDQTTTFVYDALNRVTSKTADDGASITYDYDTSASGSYNVGRLVSTEARDAGNQLIFTRTYTYDARGNIDQESLAMDGHSWSTSFSYNSADQVQSITYPDGEVVDQTFDARGMLIDVDGTDSYLSDVVYYPNANIDTVDYGNGTSISYAYYDDSSTYDASAETYYSYRLQSIDVSGGTVAFSLEYEYDRIGNIMHVTDTLDSSKTQDFTYDELDRLLSADGVYGLKNYSYDHTGNIIAKDGRTQVFAADSNHIINNEFHSFVYDGNGNIIKRIDIDSGSANAWQDNVNGTVTHDIPWNYAAGYHFTPQVDGQVVELGGFFNGTKTIRLFQQSSGELLAETSATGTNDWAYTAITPVAVQSGITYTVAVYLERTGGSFVGNVDTFPRTYGNIRIESSTYAYAGNDPTIRPTNTITDRMYGQADIRFIPDSVIDNYTETLAFDGFNRLVTVDATTTETYVYGEGEGRLKKVSGGEKKYYINKYYEEVRNGSTLSETIKHYFADDLRIATRDNDGLKYRYSDHLGSASRMANTNGTQVKATWYAPFGADAAETGSAAINYKFTDKEQDDTGFYYYSARYYDPVMGRFLSADTLLPSIYDPQQLNRYAYVRNNPIKLIDPDGHKLKLGRTEYLDLASLGLRIAVYGHQPGVGPTQQQVNNTWGGGHFGPVIGDTFRHHPGFYLTVAQGLDTASSILSGDIEGIYENGTTLINNINDLIEGNEIAMPTERDLVDQGVGIAVGVIDSAVPGVSDAFDIGSELTTQVEDLLDIVLNKTENNEDDVDNEDDSIDESNSSSEDTEDEEENENESQ